MKVLIATEKPFAAAAVEGIRKEIEGAGHELALLEKYTEKACERFLEIHPDNKYRELIAYMLDFAKKELNDLGLSEHEFNNE